MPFRRLLSLIVALLSLAGLSPSCFAGSPVRIEIGYIPILASAPLLIIDAEGWAKEAGLELKLTRFDSGPAAIQALAAGRVDVIYAGIGPVLVARGSGIDVSVIANSAVEELALVGRGELASFAKGHSGKEAIEAYFAKTGRKVKISTQPPGSVPDTVLRHWLIKVAKIDLAKVELISMGIEKSQQALLAGAVEAAMLREPNITVARDMDAQAAVLALGGEMFPNQPGTVVTAGGAFLKAHPEAAAALVRLHLKASALIAADKARAAKDAQDYIGKGLIELATTQRAMEASKFVADPHVIVAATERMQEFQREQGTLQASVPLAEVFDFSYYDAAVGK